MDAKPMFSGESTTVSLLCLAKNPKLYARSMFYFERSKPSSDPILSDTSHSQTVFSARALAPVYSVYEIYIAYPEAGWVLDSGNAAEARSGARLRKLVVRVRGLLGCARGLDALSLIHETLKATAC